MDIFHDQTIHLYHGSRSGLEGEICPCSRERCDFGRGFYMGTNPDQVKGLVVSDQNPVFYELEIDFTKIPITRRLYLKDKDWMWTVLACRKQSAEFVETTLAKQAIRRLERADIVAGPIADDRMNEAMRRFEENGLTDVALLHCLDSIDYGEQVVAKTPFACQQVTIVARHAIRGKEAENAMHFSDQKRKEGENIVNKMAARYNREGNFLSEIIENERKHDAIHKIQEEER